VARCVFSLVSALALYGERDAITKTGREKNPTWSDALLHDRVSSAIRSNMIQTVIVVVMLLLLAKLIRDGRNWSRWVYTIASIIPLGDVFKVTGFFTSGHLLFKVTYGLTGLATIVSIAMLFLPSSAAFFRPVGRPTRVSPFSALLRPRAAATPTAEIAEQPGPPEPKSAQDAPAKRTAPRSKSRKANTE
jgi:hypothetical protein